MEITFKEENIFTPEYKDNKNLPKIEQIKIFWKYPSGSERAKFSRLSTNGDFEFDYDKLMESCVIKIENLIINNKIIATGKEFFDARGIGILQDEVSRYLMDNMRGIDQKN